MIKGAYGVLLTPFTSEGKVDYNAYEKELDFVAKSDVTFAELTDEEIDYYVQKYRPMDKAGSYGVQEWIGYIGITGINGSYFNVMGLPVQRLYSELRKVKA